MAKRFTDTLKYKKPFFRGLQGPYKLLWDYLYHECDHAGIWIVDFEIAQIYLGKDMPINRDDALKFFNDDETRIIEICAGKKWFIKPFVFFQYGELNPSNRLHNSVISILKAHNLYEDDKGLTSPLQGAKDKDKDKDKDKNKDIFKSLQQFWFDYFEELTGSKYSFSGKDGQALKGVQNKLKKLFESKSLNYDEETSVHGFRSLLDSIDDKWLLDNLTLPMINSQWNKIIVNVTRKKGMQKDLQDTKQAVDMAKNYGH